MFRQQSEINCNCSLFPSAPPPHPPLFRSPQKFNPHKENKSKKSLKCHSSSRNKNIQKPSFVFNAHKHHNADKDVYPHHSPSLSTVASTRMEAPRQQETMKNNAQNLFANNGFVQSIPSKVHRSILQPYNMKQSNESVGQNYISTRAASPLGPYDANAQKRVTFNYHNQYDFRPTSTKIFAVSPPPPQKSDCQRSSGSTMMGSYVGANSELRKKYLQQKSHWSKQSISHAPTAEMGKASSIENYISIHSPQNHQKQGTSRPRTSTNLFGLSRLTEMMNEREETESIYEGEAGHDEGGIEYSRVLISCKKLMQDKNGLLEDSAQTKLFDFEEKGRGGAFRRSGLFDQIKIANH